MPTREPPARRPRDLLLVIGVATVVLGVAMVGLGSRLDVPTAHPVPSSHAAPARVRAPEPARDRHSAATAPPTGRAAPEPARCEAVIDPRTLVAMCTWRNDLGRDQHLALADMALWQRGYTRQGLVGLLEQYGVSSPPVASYVGRAELGTPPYHLGDPDADVPRTAAAPVAAQAPWPPPVVISAGNPPTADHRAEPTMTDDSRTRASDGAGFANADRLQGTIANGTSGENAARWRPLARWNDPRTALLRTAVWGRDREEPGANP
jgi:hypothetical protein